jgi:hypothetical protein
LVAVSVVLLVRACGKSLPMLFSSPWSVLGFDAPYLILTMAVEYGCWIASLLFGSFYLINPFYLFLLLNHGGYNALSSQFCEML